MTQTVLPVRIQRHIVLLRRAGIEPVVSDDGDGRWTMTLDPELLAEGDALAVVFTRRVNGRMSTDIELVIGGERQDVRDLTKAIARLAQSSSAVDGGTSAVTGAAPAARGNAVEVRRSTVIRV